MPQIAEAFVDITARLEKLRKGMRQALGIVGAGMGKMRSIIGVAGGKMWGLFLGAMRSALRRAMALVRRWARRIAFLIAGAFAVSIFVGAKFETAMARVKAITNATSFEMQKMEKVARDLGRTTVFTSRQVAEAMGFLALAGFRVTEIIKAMPATLNLAASGQLEMAQATEIVAKLLRGMGISVNDLGQTVDILVKAFTSATTNLVELGEAMKVAGPIGRVAGKGIAELVAVLQVLADAALPAERGGTALRNLLLRLSGTSTEAAKEIERLGLSFTDQTGKLKNFADIIDEIANATKNMGLQEKTVALGRIGGVRAVGALSALIARGSDELRRLQKALAGAGGEARRVAETMFDTLGGKMILVKSAAEDLGITIKDIFRPILIEGAAKLVTILIDLNDWALRNAHSIGRVLADAVDVVKRSFMALGRTIRDVFGAIIGTDFKKQAEDLRGVLVEGPVARGQSEVRSVVAAKPLQTFKDAALDVEEAIRQGIVRVEFALKNIPLALREILLLAKEIADIGIVAAAKVELLALNLAFGKRGAPDLRRGTASKELRQRQLELEGRVKAKGELSAAAKVELDAINRAVGPRLLQPPRALQVGEEAIRQRQAELERITSERGELGTRNTRERQRLEDDRRALATEKRLALANVTVGLNVIRKLKPADILPGLEKILVPGGAERPSGAAQGGTGTATGSAAGAVATIQTATGAFKVAVGGVMDRIAATADKQLQTAQNQAQVVSTKILPGLLKLIGPIQDSSKALANIEREVKSPLGAPLT